jgi:predicted Rossmann fold nucleotide-binding protein DprA/Smf involved in DNA uptake
VLLRIRAAPASADELVRAVELDAAAVAAALTELELYGLLTETSGIYRASASP